MYDHPSYFITLRYNKDAIINLKRAFKIILFKSYHATVYSVLLFTSYILMLICKSLILFYDIKNI